MYVRYLKRLYEKASAAWRRQQRKNKQPCGICGDWDSEIMPEGNFLCREHKAAWKAMLPYKSYAQRLTEMNVPFLSEEDFKKGLEPPKKKRKMPDPKVKGLEFQMSMGGRAPAKRKAAPRKKK